MAILLEFLNAIEFIEMTDSAVRGKGFVFTAQIRQAESFNDRAGELVGSYRDAGYHSDIPRLIRTAHANDERWSQYNMTPRDYWGADELSEWCLTTHEVVEQHARACRKLQQQLEEASGEVSKRLKWSKDLLENKTAMVGLSVPNSAPAARLLAAHQDLSRISRTLGVASYAITNHLADVEADVKAVFDNI